MVRNTSLIVALEGAETGRLAAFCRLLTDFVIHTTLCHVLVAANHAERVWTASWWMPWRRI